VTFPGFVPFALGIILLNYVTFLARASTNTFAPTAIDDMGYVNAGNIDADSFAVSPVAEDGTVADPLLEFFSDFPRINIAEIFMIFLNPSSNNTPLV
jgi:hypothetical protein